MTFVSPAFPHSKWAQKPVGRPTIFRKPLIFGRLKRFLRAGGTHSAKASKKIQLAFIGPGTEGKGC